MLANDYNGSNSLCFRKSFVLFCLYSVRSYGLVLPKTGNFGFVIVFLVV